MKYTLCSLFLALLLPFCACTAEEPTEPVPCQVENQPLTITMGDVTADGLYTGWMLLDQPEGEGEFHSEDGLGFTGTFAAGAVQDGKAENLSMTLVWDDLSYHGRYTGGIKNASAHGEGTFTGESITGYALELSGGWKQGLPHGEGFARAELYTALCSGAERPGPYEGETRNGLPHGEGLFSSQDESGLFSYTGQWETGCFHGQGTLTYTDGPHYIRQGTFTEGSFTPSYFEALNTAGSYEPLFSLTDSQKEFLSQYPGLWDSEHDRRNYLKSEYSKLIDYRFYHGMLQRNPEKLENTWIRLNNCRLIDRRAVTFDNGLTINALTVVDSVYTNTYQCYLVGDIPENLQQRSTVDLYAIPLGLSSYTNPLGVDVPCGILVVGDIRIR